VPGKSERDELLTAAPLRFAPIDGVDGEDDLGALLGLIDEPGAFRQPQSVARPHDERALLAPDGEGAFEAIEIFVIEHRPLHGAVLEDGYSRAEGLADIAGDVASNANVAGLATDLLELALFRSDQLNATHGPPPFAVLSRPPPPARCDEGKRSSSFGVAEATKEPASLGKSRRWIGNRDAHV
jgi:hypothetical protein